VTAARITAAEARRLGIDTPAARKRTTRRTAPARYHTRCTRCGATFRTEAAEERHLISHHHARYELVLEARR
jgi:hypothetical protein